MLHRAPLMPVMEKEPSFSFLTTKKIRGANEANKLMRTLASSPPPFAPFFFLTPSLSHPTYSHSSSKTTCTFLIPLFGITVAIFSEGVSRREGCTSGERKGERRGRDLHEERGRLGGGGGEGGGGLEGGSSEAGRRRGAGRGPELWRGRGSRGRVSCVSVDYSPPGVTFTVWGGSGLTYGEKRPVFVLRRPSHSSTK